MAEISMNVNGGYDGKFPSEKARGHLWKLDEFGSVDPFGFSYEFHNGPICVKCGYSYCVNCHDAPQADCTIGEEMKCASHDCDKTATYRLFMEINDESINLYQCDVCAIAMIASRIRGHKAVNVTPVDIYGIAMR